MGLDFETDPYAVSSTSPSGGDTTVLRGAAWRLYQSVVDPLLGTQAPVDRSGEVWPTLYNRQDPTANFGTSPQGDTRQIRLGTEYVVKNVRFAKLLAVPLRAGIFSDRVFFKGTPDFDDVDYLGWSLGTGLVWSRFSIDLGFVREEGGYNCCEYKGPASAGRSAEAVTHSADGEDQFGSSKFYVSTTVRFD